MVFVGSHHLWGVNGAKTGAKGVQTMYFGPHHIWVQKVQTSSTAAIRIEVSPPLPIKTTTELQMTFLGLHQLPKILTLNEPPQNYKWHS